MIYFLKSEVQYYFAISISAYFNYRNSSVHDEIRSSKRQSRKNRLSNLDLTQTPYKNKPIGYFCIHTYPDLLRFQPSTRIRFCCVFNRPHVCLSCQSAGLPEHQFARAPVYPECQFCQSASLPECQSASFASLPERQFYQSASFARVPVYQSASLPVRQFYKSASVLKFTKRTNVCFRALIRKYLYTQENVTLKVLRLITFIS